MVSWVNVRSELVDQFLYLAEKFPKHTVSQVASLFDLPIIERNVLIWKMIEDNRIAVDKKTGKLDLKEQASTIWAKSDSVLELMDKIEYTIEHFNEEEDDMEETLLSQYLFGVKSHEAFVALKMLDDEDRVKSYTLTNPKSKEKYTFYTLAKNLGKEWGNKQFKPTPKRKCAKRQK